jgi:hypothetical protein
MLKWGMKWIIHLTSDVRSFLECSSLRWSVAERVSLYIGRPLKRLQTVSVEYTCTSFPTDVGYPFRGAFFTYVCLFQDARHTGCLAILLLLQIIKERNQSRRRGYTQLTVNDIFMANATHYISVVGWYRRANTSPTLIVRLWICILNTFCPGIPHWK